MKHKWTNQQIQSMTDKELEDLFMSKRLSQNRYRKESERRFREKQLYNYKNRRSDTSDWSFWHTVFSTHNVARGDEPIKDQDGFVAMGWYKKTVIKNAISYLTERQAEVIKLKLGIDQDQPLKNSEIATQLNCSRSNVSKTEKAAYKRIQKIINKKGSHEFFKEAKIKFDKT